MGDLVGGRYPVTDEEWLLDGQPYPPYRRTVSRRDITSTVTLGTSATTAYLYVIPVQPGDLFNYVTLMVKTAPTGTVSHSWVGVYGGYLKGALLLAQTTDNTSGMSTGAQKLTLGSAIGNSPTVGTPQGPSTAATVSSGAAVWSILVYGPGSSAGTIFDGMAAGSVTGEQAFSTQPAMASTCTVTAGATAPATLPTLTAIAGTTAGGGVPYILLSQQ